MKTLILMAGVPGTGKSTWAKRYAVEHPNTFIIDTDETRKSIEMSKNPLKNSHLREETTNDTSWE